MRQQAWTIQASPSTTNADTSHPVQPAPNTHGDGYDRLSPNVQPIIGFFRSSRFVKDLTSILGLISRRMGKKQRDLDASLCGAGVQGVLLVCHAFGTEYPAASMTVRLQACAARHGADGQGTENDYFPDWRANRLATCSTSYSPSSEAGVATRR
jgi:hypothetical protein